MHTSEKTLATCCGPECTKTLHEKDNKSRAKLHSELTALAGSSWARRRSVMRLVWLALCMNFPLKRPKPGDAGGTHTKKFQGSVIAKHTAPHMVGYIDVRCASCDGHSTDLLRVQPALAEHGSCHILLFKATSLHNWLCTLQDCEHRPPTLLICLRPFFGRWIDWPGLPTFGSFFLQ